MTSNDFVKPDTNKEATVKSTCNKKNKIVLKAGSTHKNTEINDEYLDEIRHNNNL